MTLIRPATVSDEAFLREMLYAALFVPPDEPPLPREILDDPKVAHYVDAFGTSNGDVGFIAVEGEPIGAAWVRLLTGDDRGFGYVDDDAPELSIAVVPEHRGNGLGTALMECLLAEAPRCSLSVDDRNPALRLYERLGFVTVSSRRHSLTMLRE